MINGIKRIAKIETPEEVDRIVSNLAEELKAYDFVDAIILFGSYARGEARPLSDIDICVITKKDIDFWKNTNTVIYPEKVDISVFWDISLGIQFRVFRDGKIFYCRDGMTLHRIKVKIMQEYLDFQHITERWVRRMFEHQLQIQEEKNNERNRRNSNKKKYSKIHLTSGI